MRAGSAVSANAGAGAGATTSGGCEGVSLGSKAAMAKGAAYA